MTLNKTLDNGKQKILFSYAHAIERKWKTMNKTIKTNETMTCIVSIVDVAQLQKQTHR